MRLLRFLAFHFNLPFSNAKEANELSAEFELRVAVVVVAAVVVIAAAVVVIATIGVATPRNAKQNEMKLMCNLHAPTQHNDAQTKEMIEGSRRMGSRAKGEGEEERGRGKGDSGKPQRYALVQFQIEFSPK